MIRKHHRESEGTFNPFERVSGADRFQSSYFVILLAFLLTLSSWVMSATGLIGSLGIVTLPFIFVFAYIVLQKPVVGLYTCIIFGFTLLGLGRYVGAIPVGLAMDGMLIVTYIAIFFNRFRERIDWRPAKKDVTLLAAVWFAYTVMELVNPEARSLSAWFSGRGLGLYMMLIIPLTLLLVDSKRKLDMIFLIWGIFSILVSVKGIMQVRIGVDAWERAWLDAGNAKTHILFGKLRAFSFLSDAGQFGANQGFSGLVALIVSMAQKRWYKRLFFLLVAGLAFYGLVISGTRGAISVPLTGFALFILLRKNKLLLISGIIVLLSMFVFFKYTTIGQGNAEIRRMRTAFDPKDASLQVRLENQNKLKTYLATRPFGGGIGHAGVKAQRYLPDAYLSSIPTDSGYVLIWAETGIVGLILYLFVLLYVLVKSSYRIMFRVRDPVLKLKFAALASGMFGILVANYGNAVLSQMPTSILIYISMAILMNMNAFEKKDDEVHIHQNVSSL
jgi:O-antigen ligase